MKEESSRMHAPGTQNTRRSPERVDCGVLLEEVKRIVLPVGAYQKELFRTQRPGTGEEKLSREFVSAVDLRSEKEIRAGLLRALPEAGFYGEESAQEMGKLYTWIVDPLDGTTNYLSGFDTWSVSVALFEGKSPILGLVHKPSTGEFFTGIRGGGAFHDGKRLAKAESFPLKDGLIGTGFPYRSQDTAKSFFPAAEEILYRCRGIRRSGSAALDLSYVAAGYLQGFWEVDLKPYDVGAALLFLEESGCPVSSFQNETYDPFSNRSLVTGFPGLKDELTSILSRHYTLS
jgi:myo-inositol-1(or 4)-monophosphatase